MEGIKGRPTRAGCGRVSGHIGAVTSEIHINFCELFKFQLYSFRNVIVYLLVEIGNSLINLLNFVFTIFCFKLAVNVIINDTIQVIIIIKKPSAAQWVGRWTTVGSNRVSGR